ncbi:hypothetical protein GCM10010468_75790 [Actinocorallia longicatena]|uniref:ANTAR domain-containing protein n=2 Tax=Actinocorallia longicatena TaxID=111803 RepID=A0ABP6QLA4_9ACTN
MLSRPLAAPPAGPEHVVFAVGLTADEHELIAAAAALSGVGMHDFALTIVLWRARLDLSAADPAPAPARDGVSWIRVSAALCLTETAVPTTPPGDALVRAGG